jgi:hypothetical protein
VLSRMLLSSASRFFLMASVIGLNRPHYKMLPDLMSIDPRSSNALSRYPPAFTGVKSIGCSRRRAFRRLATLSTSGCSVTPLGRLSLGIRPDTIVWNVILVRVFTMYR